MIYRRVARRLTEGNINGIGWVKCWYILNALKRNRERECNKKRFSFFMKWALDGHQLSCVPEQNKTSQLQVRTPFWKSQALCWRRITKIIAKPVWGLLFWSIKQTSYHKTPYFSRDIDPLQFRKTEKGNLNQWKWKKMKTFKKKSSKTSLDTRN